VNPRCWTLCLAGAGHVGSGFLAMLHDQRGELAVKYGIDLRVTAVAEYGGCAVDPGGLDLEEILAALRAGLPLGEVPVRGRAGMTSRQMIEECRADFLLEATPVNLTDGEPGLSAVRTALSRGVHVVLANKGPLALAYREIIAMSDLADGWGSLYAPYGACASRAPRLRFSATVAGALPVLNIGRRDLAGDRITRIEGIFNGTTHSILRAMEGGLCFDEALADAQLRGIAETDPALDIDGHDSASKLIITANAVLGLSATHADVATTGIRGLDRAHVAESQACGGRLVLLCLAEHQDHGGYRLSVEPTTLPGDHPLARLAPDEMGVVYYTDHVNRLSGASLEPGPGPASAAMLRDVVDIVWSETCQTAHS
jgi:homoserine dehydrogenase